MYKFNVSDLSSDRLRTQALSLVLDWSIGDLTCVEAKTNLTVPYAWWSDQSQFIESNNGAGYLCRCSKGYEGNPYLVGDCLGTSKTRERSLLERIFDIFFVGSLILMHASKVPARARQTRLALTPLVAMLAIVLGVMD